MFRQSRHRQPVLPSTRLSLEPLEDRCLLSGNVLQTNLVSDLPGVAQFQDPHLVNPWGIAESATSPFWVSDNHTGLSTLYNTSGTPQSLVVSIPSPDDPLGASGAPTGTVFNTGLAAGGFQISGLSKTGTTTSAPAVFLFATEDGTIVGWNPNIDPTGKFDGPNGVSSHGVIAVDNSANPTAADGAVYKGLAIAPDGTRLYAANFRAGTIDVWGPDFKPATDLAKGAFTDPKLPKGYAPFNVQALTGQGTTKIYVTYAKQDAAKEDDVPGQGHGFVDVFNLDGSPGLAGEKVRLVSHGRLDSPWGLALAPASFGDLAGTLLVGNFGNGHINAYDATKGTFKGELKDPDGEPIVIDGLWALRVGNGGNGGDAGTVYFTAGPFDEAHGLFGSLKPVAAGTPEGPAEAQMVTAALDVFQMSLDTLQTDISSGASRVTIKQDIKDVKAAFVQFARAEATFLADSRADAGLSGHGRGNHHGGHDRDDTRALDRIFEDLFR